MAAPDSPNCLVEALRFDIGRRLAEDEQPQGQANEQYAKMRAMVDIEEWCFERVGPDRLRATACPAEAAAAPVAFMGMSLAGLMLGQAPLSPPAQAVFMYLGIARPSREALQAVIYAGSSGSGVGDGNAYLWQRQEDGHWEKSNQRLAWWIT